MKTVNILGQKYQVVFDDKELIELGADGLCETYSKRIRIRPIQDMLQDKDDLETKQIRKDEVIRHELVHAFFEESGLSDYCENEQLVDWISKQIPKINSAIEEVKKDETSDNSGYVIDSRRKN